MNAVLTAPRNSLVYRTLRPARWCNGSTSDSESLCHGSNPCRSANASFALPQNLVRLRSRYAFVEILVAHHHRRGAATGEAFDKLDRETAVLRRLQAVRVGVESEFRAE